MTRIITDLSKTVLQFNIKVTFRIYDWIIIIFCPIFASTTTWMVKGKMWVGMKMGQIHRSEKLVSQIRFKSFLFAIFCSRPNSQKMKIMKTWPLQLLQEEQTNYCERGKVMLSFNSIELSGTMVRPPGKQGEIITILLLSWQEKQKMMQWCSLGIIIFLQTEREPVKLV